MFFLPDRWTCSYSLQWVLILTPLCSCQNKKLNILTMNQVTLTIKRRIKQRRDHTFKAFIWVDFTTQDLSARNQVWILPGEVFCHVFFLVSAAWTLCCICVRVCPCVRACVNTYTWHIKVWLVLLWQLADCFSHVHSCLYNVDVAHKQPGLTFNGASRPRWIKKSH